MSCLNFNPKTNYPEPSSFQYLVYSESVLTSKPSIKPHTDNSSSLLTHNFQYLSWSTQSNRFIVHLLCTTQATASGSKTSRTFWKDCPPNLRKNTRFDFIWVAFHSGNSNCGFSGGAWQQLPCAGQSKHQGTHSFSHRKETKHGKIILPIRQSNKEPSHEASCFKQFLFANGRFLLTDHHRDRSGIHVSNISILNKSKQSVYSTTHLDD